MRHPSSSVAREEAQAQLNAVSAAPTSSEQSLLTPYKQPYAGEEEYRKCIATTHKLIQSMSLGVADVRLANEWLREASLEPRAQRLYGDLWYEGETCILFADTNVGKSILAVQIANAIAMGKEQFIPDIAIEAGRQPVLYADLELSKRQFLNRYSAPDGGLLPLANGLLRLELNYSDWEILKDLGEKKSFEDQLLEDLEKVVSNTDIKVVVVDNITFLTSCTEKTYDAMQLMKRLISFKQRFGVSLLVLAHTPKREIMRSITANDLQGSKSLINFADSAFAIGISRKSSSLRYIKQIKQRNCEQIYGAENVIVVRITADAPIEGFLRMQFERYDSEDEHVSQDIANKESRADKSRRCVELRQQGKPLTEIAKEVGLGKTTVFRILQEADGKSPI